MVSGDGGLMGCHCVLCLFYTWLHQGLVMAHEVFISRLAYNPGGVMVKNPPATEGTWVRLQVWEATCHGATKPVNCNYWARALEPSRHNYWAHTPQLLKHTQLEPVLHNKRGHTIRSPHNPTKSSHCSPQSEKAWAATDTQCSKNKINIFRKLGYVYNYLFYLKLSV